MFNKTTLWSAILLSTVLITRTVCFASTPPAKAPQSPSPNPNANQFNELSAAWWQWIFSFPGTTNPNFMNGAVDCGFGQSSHSRSAQIWFLAGTFVGSVDRTCTSPIPHGVALFFPLLNTEWDNVGCCPGAPPNTYSIQQLKQIAAAGEDNPLELHASINGVLIPAYRAQSQVFSYTMPANDNAYRQFGLDVPGVNWPVLPVFPTVSDGYWAMIDPLPPGNYTLKFGGIAHDGFSVDITYHLTVAP